MQWLLLVVIIPYIYYLLKVYVSLSGIKPWIPSSEPNVNVSLIVPCRNNANEILHLLAALAEQDYNKDLFEIVVVDDNSTDDIAEVISHFDCFDSLRLIKNSGQGKKEALLTGVKAVSGDLIITTDADCTPGAGWIRTVASFYFDNKPDLIICPVTLESKPGFFQRFQELEFLSLQGVTAGTAAAGRPVMCNGSNLAFKRSVFLEHSVNLRYDIPSGDDIFLLQSIIKKAGTKIRWLESDRALMTTSPCNDLPSFIRQRKRWISKAPSYSEKLPVVMALSTLATTLLQVSLLFAAVFIPEVIPVLLASFIMKSIPDYLILKNTTKRYGSIYLMKWFLPAQIVYPFYVTTVLISLAFPLTMSKSANKTHKKREENRIN
ncbi:MAG TPA: glycosyltransferase [Bacteroidales bacterium]|nr:glycosyltransferase [Bacteroidales bacterium]HPI67793.1 glycosyltransferase [Bacteroidales bacterium]HPR72334.1 glycosyltransferase [Bacteroidales bacterium]